MRFFRSHKTNVRRQLKKNRKADVDDTVVFKAVNDVSAYWPHVGHLAKVVMVELRRQKNRPTSRAIYHVMCQCGSQLKPRASEFDVA